MSVRSTPVACLKVFLRQVVIRIFSISVSSFIISITHRMCIFTEIVISKVHERCTGLALCTLPLHCVVCQKTKRKG